MTTTPASRRAALGKFAAPRLGRVFDRERLFALLDAWAPSPGLWVAAPPGAGKTTLITTWLRRGGAPAFWLQLDAGDADPASFANCLQAVWLNALQPAIVLPPFSGEDLADVAGWLRRRIDRLFPLLPPRWTLVLDNFQELPAGSPWHATLAAALGNLPEGVQWVMSSREPPPTAYARAIATRQLAIVGAEPMRFDAAETDALIRLHDRPATSAASLASADGWAAGLTLMLMMPSDRGDRPALEARERLFDYFAEEVLSRRSPVERRTLERLAVLPRTTPDLAVLVSGDTDAPALLERLARASLFTQRREGDEPVFVFHALFAAFLRRRLERDTPRDALRALLVRAGQGLAVAGDVEAGIACLVEGEAWDDARRLIADTAPALLAQGRAATVHRHIAALPAPHAASLAYWRGLCLLDVDPDAALADMRSAYHAAVDAGDVPAQLAACAGAAHALVPTGRLIELDPWIGIAISHADALQRGFDAALEARIVPGVLSALVNRMAWHPLCEPLAERGERVLYHGASGGGARLLLGSLAYHFMWRGQLDRVDRILQHIDALCAQGLASPTTTMRWWSIGMSAKALLGRRAAARADLNQALAVADAMPPPFRLMLALAASHVAMGGLDAVAARTHQQQAAALLQPDSADTCTALELQRALLALLEGAAPEALRQFRSAQASARQGGMHIREHLALIGAAFASVTLGDADGALRYLDEARMHPIHAVCRWHHWICGCVAAEAALQRGDTTATVRELGDALRTARDCGFRYAMLLTMRPDVLPRLMAFALEHDIEPAVVRDLIARLQLEAPESADASWPRPVRIRALGRLEVEVGGAPLPQSRKESRRLLEMLRLLAAHAGRPLPLDQIADELWPDAEGDAARNALDNALHRLRKALGGEDRILLRQGSVMLNPQRCWVDVAALEHLLRAFDNLAPDALASWVHDVRRLYTAPLLDGDTLPSVVTRRAILRRNLRRTLEAAAGVLEQAGREQEAALARAMADGCYADA